jgi:hypothetical protein
MRQIAPVYPNKTNRPNINATSNNKKQENAGNKWK